MPIIRRTLLIFLILISVASTAFAARPIRSGNSRMGVDPGVPNRTGSGWPDNGEPDDGNKKQQGGSTESDPNTDELVRIVRWLGKILMARNLGSGL
jgi:hypothetical protein